MIFSVVSLTDAQLAALFGLTASYSGGDTVGQVASTGNTAQSAAVLPYTVNVLMPGAGSAFVLQKTIAKSGVRNRTGGTVTIFAPAGDVLPSASGSVQSVTVADGDDANFTRIGEEWIY
jgi:hypothetical protein